MLSEEWFLSRKTIYRRFKPFFDYLPLPEDSLFLLEEKHLRKGVDIWVMGIDGKWLHREGVVMIYRNVTGKINLYWSFHLSESYDSIRIDFEKLALIIKDNFPFGAISDWKGAIVAAVESFLPPIPHQRCLSHVQRQLLALLPQRSPILATRLLRIIAKRITKISSYEEKQNWFMAINDWIVKYHHLLKEKTIGKNTKKKWWYTHGSLRRAVKLLMFDDNYLFSYLDHPWVPNTNNSLEGLNSQIKGKLSVHRGMETPQQVTYIYWLLTFSRVKSKHDLRKLWDRLKNKIFRF